MAYTSGDLVEATHYNGFANSLNSVWGEGSEDSGYGQGSTLSTVSAGNTVTAAQWSTLLARISSAASHQNSSITSISAPSAGDLISAYAALQGNINSITNNRRNATASGTDITTGGVGQRTTGWNQAITMAYTITFTNHNSLRYFLNGGGHIRMSFSRTGGSSHSKNTTWSALCTACGTIAISNGESSLIAGTTYTGTNKIGGSGTVNLLASTTGVYNLGTTNTNLFRQYSPTNPYTSNYILVRARTNHASTPSIVYVDVIFQDDAADDSIPSSLDVVDGTLQTTMVLRPPSTTHISNTWGTPTMSVNVSGS